MAGLREEALTQLCMLLKPFMAMAGDVVYRRGEVGRELYLHAAFILILAGIHWDLPTLMRRAFMHGSSHVFRAIGTWSSRGKCLSHSKTRRMRRSCRVRVRVQLIGHL